MLTQRKVGQKKRKENIMKMFWKSFLDLTNHHYCIERKNIYSFIAEHIRTFCHEKGWTVFSKQNN